MSITVNEWDEVRFIEHAATRPILFGGFVQSVRITGWATGGRMIEVTVVGYGILLDKKIMTEAYTQLTAGVYVSRHVVSLVNRYGGRVSALAAGDPVGGPWATTATAGVAEPGTAYADWSFDYAWYSGNNYSSTAFSIEAGPTLRAGLDAILSRAGWLDPTSSEYDYPASGVFWVDSAARLCALPDLPSAAPAARLDYQYDGATVPGLEVIPTSGTYQVTAVEYERENTDLATAVWIAGGDTPGTGAIYGGGLAHAGDLFESVSDDTSLTAYDLETRGAAAIKRTTAATVRSEVTIEGETPIAAWPGRNIEVTDARIGLAGEDWRITSVGIMFTSSAHRAYRVGFGGSMPAPRMTQLINKNRRAPL